MSKDDMLAPIIRALVGVPQERLGVLLDSVNKVGGADGELWRTRFAEVLREGVKPVTLSPSPEQSAYPVLTETRLFKPVGKLIIPARTKSFNTAAFYKTGPDLYVSVSDDFTACANLTAIRQLPGPIPERSYVACFLKENAYDIDIRWRSPEMNLSSLEDIGSIIKAQWGGKLGLLRNDGCSNIFYTKIRNGGEVFAVRVSLLPDSRRWHVHFYGLDEQGYFQTVGTQFVCPGTAVL